ncbi:hypothetical protein DGWBC_0703 [Dehalogenimonas sp. WBC-2]|nr:hypothetical protein DGWBC_0703 [Dehalogenimonas sp. WBC-2]
MASAGDTHEYSLPPRRRAIKKAAKTSNIGDGKVFVMLVETAFQIRNGETVI